MMMDIVSRFIRMPATFPWMPICHVALRACCNTFFEMRTVSTRTRLPAKKPCVKTRLPSGDNFTGCAKTLFCIRARLVGP